MSPTRACDAQTTVAFGVAISDGVPVAYQFTAPDSDLAVMQETWLTPMLQSLAFVRRDLGTL